MRAIFNFTISDGLSDSTKIGIAKQSPSLLLEYEKKSIQLIKKQGIDKYQEYVTLKLKLLGEFFKLIIKGNTNDPINFNTNSNYYDLNMQNFNYDERFFIINERYSFLLSKAKIQFIHETYAPYVRDNEIIFVCQPLSKFIKQENKLIDMLKASFPRGLLPYFKNKKTMMHKLLLLQESTGTLFKQFNDYNKNIFVAQEERYINFIKQFMPEDYDKYTYFLAELEPENTNKQTITTQVIDNPMMHVVEFIKKFNEIECHDDMTLAYISRKMEIVHEYNLRIIEIEKMKLEEEIEKNKHDREIEKMKLLHAQEIEKMKFNISQ